MKVKRRVVYAGMEQYAIKKENWHEFRVDTCFSIEAVLNRASQLYGISANFDFSLGSAMAPN